MTETPALELDAMRGLVFWLKGWGTLGNMFEKHYADETYNALNDFCVVIGPTPDGPWTIVQAIEDPDDGYRSSMKELRVYSLDDKDSWYTKNAAILTWGEPAEVHTEKRPNGEYHANDVLEFFSVYTGEVLAQMGTADTDDYYPWFVGEARPEALTKHFEAKKKGAPPS